jgi:hypothetical protein
MLTDAGIRQLAFGQGPPVPSTTRSSSIDPTQTPPPHGGATTAVCGGPPPPPPATRAALQHLVLAHCGLLTDEAAEWILSFPALRALDMRDCTLLTGGARSRLQKRVPTADVSCS